MTDELVSGSIAQEAAELARLGPGQRDVAVAKLVAMAQGDRQALVEARDYYAERLHRRADDWTATGALNLLNRAVAAAGWDETYDWKKHRMGKGRIPLASFRRP